MVDSDDKGTSIVLSGDVVPYSSICERIHGVSEQLREDYRFTPNLSLDERRKLGLDGGRGGGR